MNAQSRLVLLCSVLAACSDHSEPTVECRSAAVLGGSPRAEFLALDVRQEAAVCQLQLADAESVVSGVCTGVLVGPRTVLTAAHCVAGAPAYVQARFVSSTGAEIARLSGTVLAAHPEFDVAVITLEAVPPSVVVPIAVPSAPVPILGPRASVQVTGFGSSPSAAREFAVTQVIEGSATHFDVSADGYASLCAGDSGSPALLRGSDGNVIATGLLMGGSRSCTGSDRYLRLDAVSVWLAEHVNTGLPATPAGDCELLGVQGRCFGNTALRCQDGEVAVDSCSGGDSCGFSAGTSGFRCVRSGTDPCKGVTYFGDCSGSVSRRCVGGEVRLQPCASCGAQCMISVKSGNAICNSG